MSVLVRERATGTRVEVKLRRDGEWVGATYLIRLGRRLHAVRIDGDGEPMSRRREVDSRMMRNA